MKKILSFTLILVMLASTPASAFAATEADTGETYETVAITASIDDSGTVGATASTTTGYTKTYTALFASTIGFYIGTVAPFTEVEVISRGSYWSYVMVLSGFHAGTYGYMLSGFISYA